MSVITLIDVGLEFGKLETLLKVSFTVDEGEIVALIGPSGCGKSTLLRLIAGIIPHLTPAKVTGNIDVLNSPPHLLPTGALDMVFQESCLLPWRNATENIGLGLEIVGTQTQHRNLTNILKAVGLTNFGHCRPRQLSGGMRQRVALAASLIMEPRILLMDEPFASLDTPTKETMWRLVEELHQQGLIKTAIIVTHSYEEAVVLADRILVLSHRPGHIIAEIRNPLSRPRFDHDGLLIDGFGEVANEVRRNFPRNGNGGSQ
jgi:NitT/TauT family transport system ATP-binding protein